jgi:hypothetical protein
MTRRKNRARDERTTVSRYHAQSLSHGMFRLVQRCQLVPEVHDNGTINQDSSQDQSKMIKHSSALAL